MTQNDDKRVYLGDGVYIIQNGRDFEVITSNRIGTTNKIYLEDWVAQELINFIRTCWQLDDKLQEEGK